MTILYNTSEMKTRRKRLRNNLTPFEQILWNHLKGKQLSNYKWRRQYSIGYYIVDFYCPKLKLVIEIDGNSHFSEEGIDYDKERTEYINSIGVKVIRYTNQEISTNINGVIEDLLRKISPHLAP